jgi:hypothetical protein
MRPSAVTAHADVVLPVAPHAEKGGTFANWEGRPRSFETATSTNAVRTTARWTCWPTRWASSSDARTLQRFAPRWSRSGRGAANAPRRRPCRRRAVRRRRAAVNWRWRPGDTCSTPALQDGEPFLAGTAPRTTARCRHDHCRGLGVVDGEEVVVGLADGTEVTVPLSVTEMADGVVWLPTNSPGATCAPPWGRLPAPGVRHEGRGGAALLTVCPRLPCPLGRERTTRAPTSVTLHCGCLWSRRCSSSSTCWCRPCSSSGSSGGHRSDAAASRPEPQRSLRPPADARRRYEVDAQGGRAPQGRRRPRLHPRPAHHRDDVLRLVRDHADGR